MLGQSQGITITGGNFYDTTNNYVRNSGKGIKLLLKSSLPQAIHNSYARDPPKCHPGTRKEYIRNITKWGSGGWKARNSRALWMRGAAGVGKSALAQTCAQKIQAAGRLAATFFFYRPNGWNDPQRFIPTITFQLTTRAPAYRDLVDAIIQDNPLVLEASIDVQFEELLVKPLRELSAIGLGVGVDEVIIVDGLDECRNMTAQGTIIELITTSIHQRRIPFLWAFFSRPEPHITSAFATRRARKVSWHLTLPVSRDADKDIRAYLRDSFRMIRTKYGIPSATKWPSRSDIRCLVNQSSGLFIYPATIIRYIDEDSGALGPEERLRLVLKLGRGAVGSDGNPLSALDRFYMVIMDQIPKTALPDTLSLLSTHLNQDDMLRRYTSIASYCSIFDFSLTRFHAATNSLHSVLDITKFQSGMPSRFSFYHKSFTDFLLTPTRSGPEYCVNASHNLQRCFDASVSFLYRNSATSDVSLAWPDQDGDTNSLHWLALRILFMSAAHHNFNLTKDIMRRLSQVDWKQLANITMQSVESMAIDAFIAKVPWYSCSKAIRSFGVLDVARQTLSNIKQGVLRITRKPHGRKVYVIGNKSTRALLIQSSPGFYKLHPYLCCTSSHSCPSTSDEAALDAGMVSDSSSYPELCCNTSSMDSLLEGHALG